MVFEPSASKFAEEELSHLPADRPALDRHLLKMARSGLERAMPGAKGVVGVSYEGPRGLPVVEAVVSRSPPTAPLPGTVKARLGGELAARLEPRPPRAPDELARW